MSDKIVDKHRRAARRRQRVRSTIFGTAVRPRLTVAKSLKNVFVQLIDDEKMVTLAAAASNSETVRSQVKDGMTKTEIARLVGQMVARAASEKGIRQVVFDRNRCVYHGRVKAAAEGAREGGLEF